MKKGDKYYVEVEVQNPRLDEDGDAETIIVHNGAALYMNPIALNPINEGLTVEEVVKALGNHTLKLTGKGTGTFKETERFKNLSELTDLIRKPKERKELTPKQLWTMAQKYNCDDFTKMINELEELKKALK